MAKGFFVVAMASLLVLTSCLKTKPGPLPESKPEGKSFAFYLEQGSVSLNRGDYRKAVEEFDKAISLNPSSARAHNLLGIAQFNLRNLAAAEQAFKKAIGLNSSYSQAYNNLGGAYFLKQQFEKAEEMFKKAISLSPELISPYYSLGTLLLLLGRGEEGTRYLSRGIELDPVYLDTHKSFLSEVATAGAELAELHYAYAKIYAAKGDVEKTLIFLKKAKTAGFKDWTRIAADKEFEQVLKDPRIQEFLHGE